MRSHLVRCALPDIPDRDEVHDRIHDHHPNDRAQKRRELQSRQQHSLNQYDAYASDPVRGLEFQKSLEPVRLLAPQNPRHTNRDSFVDKEGSGHAEYERENIQPKERWGGETRMRDTKPSVKEEKADC